MVHGMLHVPALRIFIVSRMIFGIWLLLQVTCVWYCYGRQARQGVATAFTHEKLSV